jgi:hypothetical protein
MAKKPANTTPTEPAPLGSGISLDTVLKIVGSLVAVAGLVFGIYQYRQQRENAERQKHEQESAQKNQQKEKYYDKAALVASEFARASTKQEAEDKSKQFWTLYYGELSIYEDEIVKEAMQNFGGAIKQWEKYNSGGSDFSAPSMFELEDKEGKPQTFDQLAYELTQACRASLGK